METEKKLEKQKKGEKESEKRKKEIEKDRQKLYFINLESPKITTQILLLSIISNY